MTGAQIILNADLPKNLKENYAKQEDPKFQEMLMAWDKADTPALKQKIDKEIDEYWAVRRKELGFNEPENRE